MLTLDKALEELAKLTAPGKTYTVAQLSALAAQVTVDTAPGFFQGAITAAVQRTDL